ncbi:MAG: RNA methyltransferase [Planctomycetes bacterium]|nr:RNA methyltransferase [Planctomycetota bacterium]
MSVLAALGARRRRFQVVLVSDRAHPSRVSPVLLAAGEHGVPVKRVPPPELDAMAAGVTHGGVIALCTPRPWDDEAELARTVERASGRAFLVLFEGAEDAQNLGFTLRSAEALGAHAVLLKKHIWDLDSSALSRASSGAYERMTLLKVGEAGPVLDRLRRSGVTSLGCIAAARRTIYMLDLRGSVLLAVGGEKRGLSAAVRERCHRLVSIPTVPGASSLSLGHAAAVAMAEVRRQRLVDAVTLEAAPSPGEVEPTPLDSPAAAEPAPGDEDEESLA